jgi:HSP20 family protein
MAGNMTRFEPFRELMRADPFRSVDDFFKDFALSPSLRGMDVEPRIKMDVSETDQQYLIKAEIPGAKKEDIRVSVDGNQVSISAEIRQEKESKQEGNVVRSERYYGQQSRSFSLPHDVDDAQAQASYQDGILSLTLPKKTGGATKQISIQ